MSAKSAKDVMEENARKRKREEEEQDDEAGGSETEIGTTEKPAEGLKLTSKKAKKQKKDDKPSVKDKAREQVAGDEQADTEDQKRLKAEKNKMKKERRKEKAAVKQEKLAVKKARKLEAAKVEEAKQLDDIAADYKGDDVEMEKIDRIEDITPDNDTDGIDQAAATSPSSIFDSPQFDGAPAHSGTSSISSIQPATSNVDTPDQLSKPISTTGLTKQRKLPAYDPEELKARLQARIEALRAARNADGLNGKPARSRQELLDARREKEARRKALIKEQRQKARQEEEEEAALNPSPQGSGSPLLSTPASPAWDGSSLNNFSFGRIAFGDGTQADASLSNLIEPRKRKGPQDPKSALAAAEAKQKRLAGLDEGKRADIAEKDRWLNAKKHAHGERVRDDTSLLKKTLKRKEAQKRKSETEWKGRLDGVEKGKQARQKKREDNLRKRKEEKGAKGKKKGGSKVGKKAKPRPGFEGSFRAGGAKKK